MNKTGAINCDFCEAGSFSNKPGQTNCDLCESGEFQPLTGQSSCLKCTLGSFQDNQGSVKNMLKKHNSFIQVLSILSPILTSPNQLGNTALSN